MSRDSEPLIFRQLPTDQPWECFSISIEDFPMRQEQRESLRSFVETLFTELITERKFQPATWIEMKEVHRDNGAALIAANGRAWKPLLGLGVDPHGEPPRMWTKSDFLDREWGEPLPNLVLTVTHIGDVHASRQAAATMLGRGVVLHALLDQPVETFHRHSTALLLPRIREQAFRCYPFYVPLLKASSVESAHPDELSRSLGCAAVYLRECFEERQIVLLSRVRLRDRLKQIKNVRVDPATLSPLT